MNYLEIQFWKIAIWLIERGYGTGCDDFDERCPECQSQKVVEWIKNHIELLK